MSDFAAIEKEIEARRFLLVAEDENGELHLEENAFPDWQLAGIAVWLHIVSVGELRRPWDEDDAT